MSERVRKLSDLAIGDTVETPRGRPAEVKGFFAGKVILAYCLDGEEVALSPHLLILVQRAPKRIFPAEFFRSKRGGAPRLYVAQEDHS